MLPFDHGNLSKTLFQSLVAAKLGYKFGSCRRQKNLNKPFSINYLYTDRLLLRLSPTTQSLILTVN